MPALFIFPSVHFWKKKGGVAYRDRVCVWWGVAGCSKHQRYLPFLFLFLAHVCNTLSEIYEKRSQHTKRRQTIIRCNSHLFAIVRGNNSIDERNTARMTPSEGLPPSLLTPPRQQTGGALRMLRATLAWQAVWALKPEVYQEPTAPGPWSKEA